MPTMESVNGVPVSYINTLPKRRINAFGTIFCGKYDPESGLIFLLDDEEQLTDVVMQVPKKPASPETVDDAGPEPEASNIESKPVKRKRAKTAPKKETPKKNHKISFSPVPFFAGAGLVTLVTAIYVALQYAIYEGLL